jgi:hypothetical protein
MKRSNCTKIQSELDEMLLGEDCGAEVSQHLGECSECRVFYEKQIKLRQIVGSLGTVSAPADFDFRLRSRLARENANSGFQLSHLVGFGQRTAVIATALALIIAAVFVYRNFTNRNEAPQTIAQNEPPAKLQPIPAPEPKPSQVSTVTSQEIALRSQQPVTTNPITKRIKTRGKSAIVADSTLDTSSTGASVVRQTSTNSEHIFPIDAFQQSLKVSLFDGHGNPRTISLPTVSFGSQRVVPTTASFAPKGVW